MTIHLTAIDPVHLNIGSVLCPPTDLVPLATNFTARIIVFDIDVPITAGASVSVYCISQYFQLIEVAVGRIVPSFPRCSRYDSETSVYY